MNKREIKKGWLVFVILLTACCLRATITGVGSLIGSIQTEFSLRSSTAGMVSTIQVLIFAILSPFCRRD